jgi:hypothetical protein
MRLILIHSSSSVAGMVGSSKYREAMVDLDMIPRFYQMDSIKPQPSSTQRRRID